MDDDVDDETEVDVFIIVVTISVFVEDNNNDDDAVGVVDACDKISVFVVGTSVVVTFEWQQEIHPHKHVILVKQLLLFLLFMLLLLLRPLLDTIVL